MASSFYAPQPSFCRENPSGSPEDLFSFLLFPVKSSVQKSPSSFTPPPVFSSCDCSQGGVRTPRTKSPDFFGAGRYIAASLSLSVHFRRFSPLYRKNSKRRGSSTEIRYSSTKKRNYTRSIREEKQEEGFRRQERESYNPRGKISKGEAE